MGHCPPGLDKGLNECIYNDFVFHLAGHFFPQGAHALLVNGKLTAFI